MNETQQADSSGPPSKPNRQQNLASIARNSAAMLASQALIKAISFLFSVYVVRRLGATDFGLYSSIMAFAFILSMLTDLGTSTLAVREIARKPQNSQWIIPNVMAMRAIFSILMIIGNTLVAWLLGRPPEFVLGIFIASFGLLLYAFQGPLDGLLIANERLDYSSLINVLNQVTFVAIGTYALITGKGYIGLLFATLAGILVMGITAFTVIKKNLRTNFERPNISRWKALLKESLPFGYIGVLVEFTARFDIVFISFILSFAAVGYYNVSLNLILTVLLIAQSLTLAIFPSMVKEYDSGRGSIKKTVQRAFRYLLLLSLPMAIGGSILAETIIITLYGPEYREAVIPFRIMVWAIPLMYLAEILGRASITMHLERKVANFMSISAIISILLSLLLIPRFGVMGAAWGLVIKESIDTLISILILGKKLVFEDNIIPILRVILAGLAMGCAVILLQKLPILLTIDDKFALVFLISLGATVYTIVAFGIRAISPGEATFLFQSITRKFRRAS